MRFYDVLDLIQKVEDHVTPNVGLGTGLDPSGEGALAFGRYGYRPSHTSTIDADSLVELLDDRLAGGDERGSLELASGRILARKTDAQHAQIEQLLEELRQARGGLVALAVRRGEAGGTFLATALRRGSRVLGESMTRRRKRVLAGAAAIALAGFGALNALALAHARAFTEYGAAGEATPPPQRLGAGGRLRALLLGVRLPRPENERTPAATDLSFTVHALSASDGLALEAWHVPAEAPRGVLLLVPGYAASKSDLLPVAREVHSLGWSVLLLDPRGVGGSAGRTTTLGVHEAHDVAAGAALARTLAQGRPVVVYAVSMGAAAALRAVAHEGLALDGLVLESPFDRLLTTVGHRFELMGLPARPGADLLVFWGGVARGIDVSAHDPVAYARACAAPTLVIHGAGDPNVRSPEARAVADALPRGELLVLDDAGHANALHAAAEPWRRGVGAFLRSLERARDR